MSDSKDGPGLTARLHARGELDAVERGNVLANLQGKLFGASDMPPTLDRYVVIKRLGAGGAGVVYMAYDPTLDRRVAIKLLHANRLGAKLDSEGRARLLREAQAIARLSHPNVIAVHDVGTYEAGDHPGVFMVMEYVAGSTLSDWARAQTRPWYDAVRLFLGAGRGLEAAHAKGLVHRDFKPSNVLVGDDGRARVLDFGLARTVADAPIADADASASVQAAIVDAQSEDSDSPPGLAQPLTMAGVVMGTPPYMAPEQHRGEVTDARSDQFGFCVSLFGVLYGARPFDGKDLQTLLANKEAEHLRAPAADTRVPAAILRVLQRGLRADPQLRFGNMSELLEALEQAANAPRRRRNLALASLAVVVAGGTVAGWQIHRAGLCAGPDRGLEDVWDARVKRDVREAMLAVERPYVEDAFASVDRALTDYADQWNAAWHEACQATRLRGERSAEVLRRSEICLDRARGQIAAMTELLQLAEPEFIVGSAEAVASLPLLDQCLNPTVLEAQVTSTDADPETLRSIEREIARAGAAVQAQPSVGAAAAEAALESARRIGDDGLAARASLLLGRCASVAGEVDASEAHLYRAWTFAESAGDEFTAIESIGYLVLIVGARQHRFEDGDRLTALAKARLRRRSFGGYLEYLVRYYEGWQRVSQGIHADALERFERSLLLAREVFGREHPRVGRVHAAIGETSFKLGKVAEGRAAMKRALAVAEHSRGPLHPYTLHLRKNLAKELVGVGLGAEALADLEALRETAIEVFGKDGELVLLVDSLRGQILVSEGSFGEAEVALTGVVGALERTLSPTHRELRTPVQMLGRALAGQNRHTEAIAQFERALRVQRLHYQGPHAFTVESLRDLARSHLALGDRAAARTAYEQATAMLEDSATLPDTRLTGELFAELGRVQLDEGQRAAAARSLEKGVAMLERHAPRSQSLADARLALAEAQSI